MCLIERSVVSSVQEELQHSQQRTGKRKCSENVVGLIKTCMHKSGAIKKNLAGKDETTKKGFLRQYFILSKSKKGAN